MANVAKDVLIGATILGVGIPTVKWIDSKWGSTKPKDLPPQLEPYVEKATGHGGISDNVQFYKQTPEPMPGFGCGSYDQNTEWTCQNISNIPLVRHDEFLTVPEVPITKPCNKCNEIHYRPQPTPTTPALRMREYQLSFTNRDAFLFEQPNCKIIHYGKVQENPQYAEQFFYGLRDGDAISLNCGGILRHVIFRYSNNAFYGPITPIKAPNANPAKRVGEVSGDLYKLGENKKLFCPLNATNIEGGERVNYAKITDSTDYVMPITVALPNCSVKADKEPIPSSFPVEPEYIGDKDITTEGWDTFGYFGLTRDTLEFRGLFDSSCDMGILP